MRTNPRHFNPEHAARASGPTGIRRTLPAPLTVLVGREAEARAACAMLIGPDTRLLTVTGPPGIGKTRLALRVAQLMGARFDDGVCYVPLANVSDAGMVVPCIARALGLDDMEERLGFGRLKDYLGSAHALLVLDNFEQVAEAAPAVAELMEGAPGVRVLVTSRTLLNVYGERVLPVPPLALPTAKMAKDITRLAQCESVALFVERAVAARPDFALNEANAETVAEICGLLEGVPLAIELAAARMRASSAQAILDRLRSEPLHFLKGGAQNTPLRQQTLREAIGWSYRLLNAAEQRVLRRISVFVGGCALESASAISDFGFTSRLDSKSEIRVPSGRPKSAGTLELLESLVSKSLLSVEEVGEETRFGMLNTIREYALERLEREQEGEAEAARLAHATYFLELAERAKRGMYDASQSYWLNRLETEHDNIRAALRWLVGGTKDDDNYELRITNYAIGEQSEIRVPSGRPKSEIVEMGLRLTQALWLFWEIRGYLSEGYKWIVPVLENEAAMEYPALRAKALVVGGRLALIMGDLAAARRLYAESLELSRQSGDPVSVSFALTAMGHLAVCAGDLAGAEPLYRESLEMRRSLGETRWVIHSLVSLGDLCSYTGRYEEAARMFAESLALAEGKRDDNAVGRLRIASGHLESRQGNYAGAEAYYLEGIGIFEELKSRQGRAECLAGLAEVAYRRGRLAEAAILFGWVYSVFRSIGLHWDLTFHSECEAIMANLEARLGSEEYRRLEALGASMPDEDVVAVYGADGSADAEAVRVPAVLDERMPIPIMSVQRRGNPWGLTGREMEVLRLVASGMTNAEAAERLIVSPYTVNMHLRSIYMKLGVTNRSAATRYAVERNIV